MTIACQSIMDYSHQVSDAQLSMHVYSNNMKGLEPNELVDLIIHSGPVSTVNKLRKSSRWVSPFKTHISDWRVLSPSSRLMSIALNMGQSAAAALDFRFIIPQDRGASTSDKLDCFNSSLVGTSLHQAHKSDRNAPNNVEERILMEE